MADGAVVESGRVEWVRRFTVAQIIEHWIQVVAFVMLAVTGIPQRYAGARLSKWIIDVMGGIEAVRIIHRAFAAILMVAVVYHFAAIGYRKFVKGEPKEMVPGMNDLRAIGASMGHALGIRKHPPRQGRYTWEEKAEYWALIWGTVVMIITGFLLWNPIATTQILPGDFVPAAKAAHSGEALLAVLAVIVWHMYHVHVREFNTSMFTGYLSRRAMEEEHPLELEAIEAGAARGTGDAGDIRRRSRLYYPAAVVVSGILLVGIYFFTTFESTAITTIEPIEEPQVFAPVETTTTEPQPTTTTQPGATTTTAPGGTTTTAGAEPPTWDTVVAGLFEGPCTGCHGGGSPSAGLDLTSYEGIMAGGGAGPGVVPGDPDASSVVSVMESGHFAVLGAEELAVLREWIGAGAPEMPGTVEPPPAAADTWDGAIAALFDPLCTGCHGTANQTSGLSLASLGDAVAGGRRGPGIVPGDPDASVIVQIMEAGGHPAGLDAAQIEQLRAWIAAGAPETEADVGEDPPPTTTATTTAGEEWVWDDFAGVIGQRCTSCHNGDDLVGGLDLTTYRSALEGGSSGPGIVPGDPEASTLYRVLESGAHPAVLPDDIVGDVYSWIEEGAPEN